MDKESLFFAISNWGEYGVKRFSATLQPNEKRRIPILIPAGRRWLVFKYRFGDVIADVFNFNFDGIRNYFEQNILITTELLNFVVEPQPYLSISGVDAVIAIENTDIVARDFSIVLDFIVLDDEIQGRIRELIYAKREVFRGEITSQAGTGGA